MSNNITKTIMESMESYEEKFNVFGECNPPHCHNIRFGGNFVDIGNHLLQSQIKVIEAVEMELRKSVLKLAKHKECHEGNCEPCENCMSVLVLSDFVSDQISSLNETLEFLKKSL